MDWLTYDNIARVCMVSSLLLFFALFTGVLAYVLGFAKRDALEKAQRDALDLDKNGTHR